MLARGAARAFDIRPGQKRTIHVHVATGAPHEPEHDDKKQSGDAIIYPDQLKIATALPEENVTADVARMTVTPSHGTVTFKIDPNKGTALALKADNVSLDSTSWQKPLEKFGWDLARPPRVRVFYV